MIRRRERNMTSTVSTGRMLMLTMLLAELEVLIIIKVEDLLLKVSISLGSVRVEAVSPTSSRICLVRQAEAVAVRVA